MAVTISGFAAAAVLAALIMFVPVLAELLSNSGNVDVPAAETDVLKEWGVTPVATDAQTARYEQCGLLPTVWQSRQTIIGPFLIGMYRSLGVLRNNQTCLLAIMGCVGFLGCLAAVMLYWLERSANHDALRVAGALRDQIYGQSHRLGAGDLFVGQKLTATVLFSEKTETVRRTLVKWWYNFPHAASFALLMFGLALCVDFWLALTTVLLSIFSWRLFVHLRKGTRQRAALHADRAGAIEHLLQAELSQNRLLANLTMENRVDSSTFEENIRRYETTALAQETSASVVGPLVLLCALLVAGFVILLAGFNVLRDPARLSFSGVVLLSTSLLATTYPLFCFERLLEQLPAAEEAAHDIFTYLDREPRIGQLPDATPLERLSRQMKLEHVTLADMAGRLLLDDVSFSLPAGRATTVFCSDDKTPLALAGLLSRFCDPAAGQVLFDERDVRHATLESVRRQVSLVLPQHMLTTGTIAENIVGDHSHFTPDDIIAAARQVHAYEFIQSLPEGLETPLGPSGLTLSAGQAIRLGLARVLLRRPSVVVIEEPREDLDQITAERVADALERATQGCTLVILARRLATLRNADRILLFHEGQLLADSSHQELLQHNDLYRHLNYVRFNEFRDKVR
ncbi:MAG TPA: ABC transporter ATP-binding protein [Pirellulales bacterium]|nr:ABC transporter ATP-binding protein [Pirellulales bacterium]